jgi:uncharacterized protein
MHQKAAPSAGAAVPSMEPVRLSFGADHSSLTALLLAPPTARALYVLGHGAGAGMEHPFMRSVSEALAARGVATFRYNFPYTEIGRGRPDPKPVLLRAVRAAVSTAAAALPGLPLFAGGKSMGGRMTSEAQAREPLPGVRGLVFLGFPLHPPKRPNAERARHLAGVELPMLFVQGTRDDLAELDLVRPVVAGLGDRAHLHLVQGADHGFSVLRRSGRSEAEVMTELATAVEGWIGSRGGDAEPGG